VLEIGTGSGYTAAVMSRLATRIVTVDRYKTLVEQARQRFEALGIGNVIVRQTDGSGGLPAEGPFDRIVAWAAFDSLPRFLLDQLSSGGIVIAPIGPEEGEQVLAKLTKVGSRFEREDIGMVRLQPILRSVAAVL
jgi:protein-L-isoaspartate(D-aspartate) O-methyltransferase